MKIIVTGATGSLGAFLVRWLATSGHQIIATGRISEPPALLHQYATYLPFDITKPFEFPDADICIHCAAIADDKASFKSLYDANVNGTINVSKAARNCSTFIHVSSSSVYINHDGPIDEGKCVEAEINKLSLYGKSKLLAEINLHEVNKNKSCFILRPRGIYGPGDKVLLPRLLKLVRGEKMLRPGGMNVSLSMTHFQNFAHAIECCINSNMQGTRIYNVADERPYNLYQTVRLLLLAIYHKELPERYVPITILRFLALFKASNITPLFINTITEDFVLDIKAIQKDLNYHPVKNIANSLGEIADWVERIGGPEMLKTAKKEIAWTE